MFMTPVVRRSCIQDLRMLLDVIGDDIFMPLSCEDSINNLQCFGTLRFVLLVNTSVSL
uniref:Uncharacterized protein n=1 Tax=Arundo donax TaxID=35708 RepID=A0A0A9H000_ARUDO